MSFLGLSFGGSTTKTSSTDNVNKTESTNQTQTSNQSQKTTGSQQTDQTGATTNAGTSTTTNSGTTSQTSATSQQQTGVTSSFSADVLSKLTDLFNTQAGGAGTTSTAALNTLIGQLGSFNANDFVKGTVDAARSTIGNQTDIAMHGSDSRIGGTASTNSMAALKDASIQDQAAATLAGVQSQAEAQAQQIIGANAATVNKSVEDSNSLLLGIVDALKGGQTTTTAATTGTGTTTGTSTNTSGTSTTESGTSKQSTSTVSQQDVATLIQQLLSGVTNTVGTESQTGSNTKLGGGFSLGI